LHDNINDVVIDDDWTLLCGGGDATTGFNGPAGGAFATRVGMMDRSVGGTVVVAEWASYTGVTTGGGKKWLFFLFAGVCLFVR
jgi:hypothetical protein